MNSLIYRLVLLLILSSLLSCTTTGMRSVDEAISDAVLKKETESAQLDETSPEYYINLASQAEGKLRHQYLIKAAELLIQRGDIDLARDQLKGLDPNQLEATRQLQIELLAARIALANDNPVEAVELLPDYDLLTPGQVVEAEQIRADASFRQGWYREAAGIRIAIDPEIEADDLREQNHHAIWLALSSIPEISLADASADDPVTLGWLELARIFRASQLSTGSLQQDILDWGLQYPEHPVSNAFIDSIIDLHIAARKSRSTIAVMLPMSGKLAAFADAIRGGLLSAHYRQVAEDEQAVVLRFYDTADPNIDFDSLYRRAVDDGAAAIIGPIDKTSINKLAQQIELDVPVLTLNYAENAFTSTANLYQFGLLPEDEAGQAAELAIRDDRQRAVVLVPDSEWGTRLADAFSRRFRQLGGDIVRVERFDQEKDDYSGPIRALFEIDRSNRRHRDIERLLNAKLKFQPQRRLDVDMIFLAATSRSARGIMPAFRFHHAGELPVYATSHVYTGSMNKKADRDLNGIMFCDLPWTITTDSELKSAFAADWPEHRNLTRLFAMGADAYHLVNNLGYLTNTAYARFPGETGNLYLDEYGRFHRDLVWAQFRGGLPRYMDTFTAPRDETGEQADVGQDGQAGGTGML